MNVLPPQFSPPPAPPSHTRNWDAIIVRTACACIVAIIGTGVYVSTDAGEPSVMAQVVDCSSTGLWSSGAALTPARRAQIQFVNMGDTEVTFVPQVNGVGLEVGGSKVITLPPQGSKIINYALNPKEYGNSEGACYALNVGAGSAP